MTQLKRFIAAQAFGSYETALAEIRVGKKQGHWMWFIFPQLKGLGFSEMADYYGIADLAEAKAYIANEVLGTRLIEITRAALELEIDDADAIFGYPDDLKFRSSMALFSLAAPDVSEFQQALDKFFVGKPDEKTIASLKAGGSIDG